MPAWMQHGGLPLGFSLGAAAGWGLGAPVRKPPACGLIAVEPCSRSFLDPNTLNVLGQTHVVGFIPVDAALGGVLAFLFGVLGLVAVHKLIEHSSS